MAAVTGSETKPDDLESITFLDSWGIAFVRLNAGDIFDILKRKSVFARRFNMKCYA